MPPQPCTPSILACDVLVYGSTPGGLAAALEAARRGRKVVLACPRRHLGGMMASGLCTTDAVRRHLFGALVGGFVARVRARYLRQFGAGSEQMARCQDGWYYEPSVAEACFAEMVAEQGAAIDHRPGLVLERVEVADGRLAAAWLGGDAGRVEVRARMWIDGTYEGDLAAAAGASYRVGREAAAEHGESLAGIRYVDWRRGCELAVAESGDASPAIQAFCARCILTDDPDHLVPIARPASYERHLPDYLPLLDDAASGRVTRLGAIMGCCRLPNRKLEINGHIEALTSLNCPGVSWEYPEAGPAQRAALDRFHIEHVAGLLWFLQHEPRVPADLAAEARRYGLHDGEFVADGHWPWQIYVRQGRRIRGRALLTQHSFTPDPASGRTPRVEDAVALGEHSFDVHPCHDRRHAHQGFAEGVLWYPNKAAGPARPGQIPYGALLPRGFDNLIVPVALSCTHVAMSVLRMEPVWMTTGQVAGAAACAALDQRCSLPAVDGAAVARNLGIVTDPDLLPTAPP